jgi:membrane-bound lytic murein transglycosylase D
MSEVAAELKQEADSAADEQALDELADAEANAPELPAEAGEELPVTWDLDVVRWNEHERVQYWLRYFQGPARERFQIWLDRMPRYEPMVRGRLQAANMPTDLVYLALIESGFSNTAVSRARATGMWQFMRPTGKEYGLRIDSWVDERRDPMQATGAALRYLSDLYDRFGSYYLAAAAYNAGGGKISRGLRRIGMSDDDDLGEEEAEDLRDADFFRLRDTRHIRQETKDYVPKLIAAALIAKEPVKYGFTRTFDQAQYPLDSLIVPGMTGLDVVARMADTSLAAMKELNPHFLRLVTPPGSASVVRLPAGTMEPVATAYAALPAVERTSFRYHTTKAGDTPARIAEQFGVPLASVLEANPGIKNGSLKAGKQIVVPTGGESSVLVARQVATYRDGVDGSGPVRYHKVRSGETLGGIARKYRVSVSNLKAWNGLRGTTIRAGQKLRVYGGRSTTTVAASRDHSKGGGMPPGTASVRHRVRRGETLSGIAQHYGVTIRSIKQANDLSRGLKAGTTIRIPRRT